METFIIFFFGLLAIIAGFLFGKHLRVKRIIVSLGVAAIVLWTVLIGLAFLRWKPVYKHDMQKALAAKNVVPVVVIGSGPAGLSAALYAARSSLYTIVFEGKTPGGQLTGTTYVENWPGTGKLLGSQLIDQTRKQAEKFGAVMIRDIVTAVDFSSWPFRLTTEEGHTISALAIIIATGAEPKLLNDTRKVPGEKEYWGYGVTTCAICDAPFYKGKKVVVVGGGDSAIEEATLLTSYAQEVTVIVRGATMRAAPAMQARLKDSPKIKVLYNTEIEEILGNGSSVTGVRLITKGAVSQETVSQEKKSYDLHIDGVFLAIGHRPNTELFKKYVSVDSEGYIHLDPSQRRQETTVPGIFAAGDVADHVYRQAGVAAGDGIKAALDAINFLQKIGYTQAIERKMEKNFYEPHSEAALKPLEKLKTNKDFEKKAKEQPFLVIEVGAEHCSSCKALLPVVQAVAAQLADKVSFAQIDLGDEPVELVKRFDIKAIPTILAFKGATLVARYDQQLFTKRELAAAISQLIEK